MGLDGMLYRKVGLKDELKNKLKEVAGELFEEGEGASYPEIETEICYWRKFNALHKYFVDRFGREDEDNCVPMRVEIEDIEELLEHLKDLYSKIKVEDGIVTNGLACGTWEADEIIDTERGKIPASEIRVGDIVINQKMMSGGEKAWVNSVENTEKGIRYDMNYKEKGRVIKNPEICREMLPTQSGFFFGSTDYDEWYLRDIEGTIPMLEKVLEKHKRLVKDGYSEWRIEYYYRASY